MKKNPPIKTKLAIIKTDISENKHFIFLSTLYTSGVMIPEDYFTYKCSVSEYDLNNADTGLMTELAFKPCGSKAEIIATKKLLKKLLEEVRKLPIGAISWDREIKISQKSIEGKSYVDFKIEE